MSTNSSSSNSFVLNTFLLCIESNFAATVCASSCIFTKSVLIIPLSIFILHLGHQRWRRQRSFAAVSHSDIFTFHLAVMELIGFSGNVVYLCGFYLPRLFVVGFSLAGVTAFGEMLFHVLTCVERYLAVVHPVTYRGLKQAGGIRIRNICIGCIWLLCFGCSGVVFTNVFDAIYSIFFCILTFYFTVITFCSISVLCALIRPKPGEGGGDREQVDQSKQRALHTIMAITAVLLVLFVRDLVSVSLIASALLSYSDRCLVLTSAMWFSLPSSLVIPLLFLHRAQILTCCCSVKK
ncbi:uncharacterized protein LOC129348080 [Amphiprion ocellaris]|uniref:uncharacterized protein LOC129348080 n=1 Tax=Amphiprion ocellaris TaxID=80972 RepID=UPI002410BBC0|nr:uncharacterized protein LOC129348080 [Amphiprion ocellaris]